jgi:hypothetical protein
VIFQISGLLTEVKDDEQNILPKDLNLIFDFFMNILVLDTKDGNNMIFIYGK